MYAEVETQCFSTGVRRQISLGVPPNLKMHKRVCKNRYIFIILVYFFALRSAVKLVFKISVPQAHKG